MDDITTGILCLSTSTFLLVWAYNMYKSQRRAEAAQALGLNIIKGYAITGAACLVGALGLGIKDMRDDEQRHREEFKRAQEERREQEREERENERERQRNTREEARDLRLQELIAQLTRGNDILQRNQE